jgi:hypothetical protein
MRIHGAMSVTLYEEEDPPCIDDHSVVQNDIPIVSVKAKCKA